MKTLKNSLLIIAIFQAVSTLIGFEAYSGGGS